jgi:hypothetical protein
LLAKIYKNDNIFRKNIRENFHENGKWPRFFNNHAKYLYKNWELNFEMEKSTLYEMLAKVK